MITLITGGPGAGKSNLMMSTAYDELLDAERPIFVHGIKDLNIEHEIIKCDSRGCLTCREFDNDTNCTYVNSFEMHLKIPDTAIVILDECQHIYRPRKVGSSVPDNVQWLETHRHAGIDIWMITQSPKIIDINCREMVTRHQHILVGVFNRQVFEWPECQTDTKSGRGDAVKTVHRLDKRVFGLYKSAEEHFKQKRKVPFIIYMVPPLLIFTIGFGYNYFSSFSERHLDAEAQPSGPDDVEITDNSGFVSSLTRSSSNAVNSLQFEPREAFMLETAPIYDDLVSIKDFPRAMACMADTTRCSCYTQQGTHYPTTATQCFEFIQNHYFNPYIESADLDNAQLR